MTGVGIKGKAGPKALKKAAGMDQCKMNSKDTGPTSEEEVTKGRQLLCHFFYFNMESPLRGGMHRSRSLVGLDQVEETVRQVSRYCQSQLDQEPVSV